MMWDLIAEHESAYGEELCKQINDISDMFDPIFEYMYKHQHLDWCIDVFPCEENPAIEIPQKIRKYYDMYLEEEYRKKMKDIFDFTLSGKAFYNGTLEEVFRHVIRKTQFGNKKFDCTEIDAIIHGVTNMVVQKIGQNITTVYEIDQKCLNYMKEEYLGILFAGFYFKYGNYAFMIFCGSSD